MKKTTKKEVQERFNQNEKKWTPPLMKAGWTVMPSVILERQQALGLDAMDVNILMHLAKYWWYSENPPHPSKQSIAECMGVDKSTIRKRIARMENDGLIRRQSRFDKKYGQQPNSYHFDGLIKEATPFAEEAIADRKKNRKTAAKRRISKKPKKTSN